MAIYNGKSIPTDNSKDIITWSEEQKTDIENGLKVVVKRGLRSDTLDVGGTFQIPLNPNNYYIIGMNILAIGDDSPNRVWVSSAVAEPANNRYIASVHKRNGNAVVSVTIQVEYFYIEK